MVQGLYDLDFGCLGVSQVGIAISKRPLKQQEC